MSSAHCAVYYSLLASSLRTLLIYQKEKEMKLQAPQGRNLLQCSKKNGFSRSLKQKSHLQNRQMVKIGDIFIHQETSDVICSICSEANAFE
jgi:hypothetical protein